MNRPTTQATKHGNSNRNVVNYIWWRGFIFFTGGCGPIFCKIQNCIFGCSGNVKLLYKILNAYFQFVLLTWQTGDKKIGWPATCLIRPHWNDLEHGKIILIPRSWTWVDRKDNDAIKREKQNPKGRGVFGEELYLIMLSLRLSAI